VRATDAAGNTSDGTTCSSQQLVVYDPSGGFVTGGGWINSPAGAAPEPLVWTPVWSQGFETSTEGWYDYGDGTVNQEPSGFTDAYASGISSASGDYHARLDTTETGGCAPPFSQITTCVGPYTAWGGYSATFPTGGYTTKLSIYLDISWAASYPDRRFDWDVASSDSDGNSLQDYVFNAGTSPNSEAAFVVSAGTNAGRANSYPSNPGQSPVTITSSGWYTFVHHFYNDSGYLAVDMSILDSSGNTVGSWTIQSTKNGNPVPIADAGGHRYGWFPNQEIDGLPIDDATLLATPTGKATFGFVSKYKKGADTPSGQTEFQFKAAGLSFHSTSYQWLVVNQGGTNAQFKGTGKLNGSSGYGFMLWATDGSPDMFRIKITDPSGNVVYDNGAKQPIEGGNIIVHK